MTAVWYSNIAFTVSSSEMRLGKPTSGIFLIIFMEIIDTLKAL